MLGGGIQIENTLFLFEIYLMLEEHKQLRGTDTDESCHV